MFYKIDVTTSFPTNNLKQDYTKAEDIGLHREYSSIAYSGAMYRFLDTKTSFFLFFFYFFLFFIKKTNKKRNKRSGLLCSYNSFGAIYILVFTTDPCHSKIRYFGNHVMVQQHITRL